MFKTVLAAIKCGCFLIALRMRPSRLGRAGGPLLHSRSYELSELLLLAKAELSTFFRAFHQSRKADSQSKIYRSIVTAETSLALNLRKSVSLGYSLIGGGGGGGGNVHFHY